MGIITGMVGFVGGLALVLFGINLLSQGMEKFTGGAMQRLIERLTSNRFKGFGVGFFASALLQSSTMVMVTMIGMINAGLMGLGQGVSVILGFEIGTTLTVQLISFNIGNFYFGVLALGFFLNYLSTTLRRRYLGQAILGVGMLFLGITVMKEAMVPLLQDQSIVTMITLLSKWPLLAVLSGMVITAIIHSSSAMVGMVVAMGAAGAITLPAAIAIGFGANIGTCFTGFVASLTGTRSAKQASIAQILVATSGMLIFLPILNQYAGLMSLTASTLPRQIANAHTIHNTLMSLLLLPFVGLIARVVRLIMPDSKDEHAVALNHIEPEKDPAAAVEELRQQTLQLGRMSQGMLNRAGPALLMLNTRKRGLAKTFQKVMSTEALVDKFTSKIEEGINKIPEGMVTKAVAEQRVALRHNIMDIERVGDLSVNLMEFAVEAAESVNCFDSKENAALLKLFTQVSKAYATALEALEKQSPAIAREARFIEERVDAIDAAEHKAHLRRLDRGASRGRGSVIFENAMHDLERISDHADNIALSIVTLHESGLLLPD